MKYWVSLGPTYPTDSLIRLSRGGIECRDYFIDSIPWIILSCIWQGAFEHSLETVIELDKDVGEHIWNSFGPDTFEEYHE